MVCRYRQKEEWWYDSRRAKGNRQVSVGELTTAYSEPPWLADININGTKMTIKIDTGADVTVVNEKLYKRHLGGIALTNARKNCE